MNFPRTAAAAFFSIVVLFGLVACSSGSPSNLGSQSADVQSSPSNMASSADSNPQDSSANADMRSRVVDVTSELVVQDSKGYGIFTGRDADGNKVWVYTTQAYEMTELGPISELGINGDRYFLEAGGDLVCLDLERGVEVWKNPDFGGGGAHATWDEQGNTYATGYYSPSLFVADRDGNTVKRIPSFNDDYYWPYDISYNQGVVRIEFKSAEERGLDYSAITYDIATDAYEPSK